MNNKKLLTIFVVMPLLAFSLDASAQKRAGTARGSVRLPEEISAEKEAAPAEAPMREAGEPKEAEPKEELVYLNVQDQDIVDVIRQISKATGRNFIIDDRIRGKKVTIMSEKLMTKEEAYQAFLSALEVAGFTTVTGPGGIIKIVSLKEAVASPIPIHVDSTPYTDSYVTRLISLQNISASDMSEAIKGLISKSGNMFAYPATNTLIITDSGTNIDRLMKIIKELDQEGPQQVLEVIPVNYADAEEVASTVLGLFEIEEAQARGRPRRGKVTELEEIKEVSKIIADKRTNSLIVLASTRGIKKVREVIAKLDMPLDVADTGTIHVHPLKFANAMELAETLSAVTSGTAVQAAQKGAEAKGKAGAIAKLEGGINIGADETTNALIITASARDYKLIVDELISKLDIPRRQVYLESIVMELEVEKGSRAGASGYGGGGNSTLLGFGGVGSGDYNILSSMFSQTPMGFFASPGLLGGILSRDSITIDVPQSSGGTTQVTIPAFAAFLNFLQTYRDANIVSTPNILTLDNQKASIEVTRTIYANKITQSGTTGFQTVEPSPLEAGLTLEITPQITEGDAVRLEIHHKLSNFTGLPNESGAAPQTKREVTTTVVAMDGQTVVLGGLMEDITTHERSKVPILGDIPILGLLFRTTMGRTLKNNLLVFITPHVIHDPTDFAEVSRNKIEQRNRFIEKNYGKRQRRTIRETIAMHRADLLEFTPAPAAAPPPGETPASGPVITVPPADGGQGGGAVGSPKSKSSATITPAGPKNKGTEGIDLAY